MVYFTSKAIQTAVDDENIKSSDKSNKREKKEGQRQTKDDVQNKERRGRHKEARIECLDNWVGIKSGNTTIYFSRPE